jgi:hypothetical protein
MNDTEFILFAIAIQFNKTLGTIKLFWQAVPRMNHSKVVATSVCALE